MSDVVLSVREVSKRFGGVIANDRISFDVERGELISIIGPNGAGKSTLFKMVCGVTPAGSSRPPDHGRVFFLAHDVTTRPAHKICRIGLALVFQETEPLEGMTARENVAIGSLVRHSSYHDALEKSEAVLERVGLVHKATSPVDDLTLSERKRLEIGRALATEPSLLLLDETMAGLTLTEVNEAIGLVQRLNDAGITVILIEHVLEAVMAISNRIIVLDRGRKIADDVPNVIVNDPAVVKAYLGGEIADA